jgi:hypothetical protein
LQALSVKVSQFSRAGDTLFVGPQGAQAGTVSLSDGGTLTFATGDAVTLDANATNGSNSTAQVVIGSGGLLTASGTTFSQSIGNDNGYTGSTLMSVSSGGHLQASNSTFAVGQLNLAVGSLVNSGDLVGDAFNLPL